MSEDVCEGAVSSTNNKSNGNCVKTKRVLHCSHEGCDAVFSKNSKLISHISRHTGERPFACDEIGCNKTYLYNSHLRRHKAVSHSRQVESVTCPYEDCQLVIASKYNLKRHINRMHNPKKKYPFMCPDCQRGFHKKYSLVKHSYEHTNIPPYKCDICEGRFKTLADCSKHKRTHRTYMCRCEATFERWSNLLAHKKTCSVVKPTCKICSKTFMKTWNLRAHLKVHIEEGSKDVFLCYYEGCDKFYFYKKNLHHHIEVFHKKKKTHKGIPCTEENCNQTFARQQCLKLHIQRIHFGGLEPKLSKAKRKDVGIPKKCMASILSGVDLPNDIHQFVIDGGKVTLSEESGEIFSETHTIEGENITENNCSPIFMNLKNVNDGVQCEGEDSKNDLDVCNPKSNNNDCLDLTNSNLNGTNVVECKC